MFRDVKIGDRVFDRSGNVLVVVDIDDKLKIFKTDKGNWFWMDDGKQSHFLEAEVDIISYFRRAEVNQPARLRNEIVSWIQNWFKLNGDGCKAVIGISGGKDSSVVAALCVEALGKDRVVGVLMPNKKQDDIEYSHMLVKHLGIESFVVNIGDAYKALTNSIDKARIDVNSSNAVQNNPAAKPYDFNSVYWNNTPARLRMTTLYGIAAIVNGRVANTCNLSEDWVGYSTKYGDAAGDFSPLSDLTVTEVKALGYQLGLPKALIEKVPTDGLCGQTDEDRLGFTYAVLDRYIRTGEIEDLEVKAKIDAMNAAGLHKLRYMDGYKKSVK